MNVSKKKNSLFITIIILAIAAIGGYVLLAPDSQSDTQSEGALPPLVFGTNAAFPPFESIGGADGNTIVGFDVAIVERIAKNAGREYRIADVPFDSVLVGLQQGKFDAAISALTITEQRQKSVDFSEPYYEATQRAMVNKGTEINSIDDLADLRIAVQLASSGEVLINSLFPQKNVSAFKSPLEGVSELNNGKVDVFIFDDAPAKIYINQNENLTDAGLVFEPEYYGIAVAQGNDELLQIINDTIAEMRADGSYDTLIAEYF